MNLQKKRVYTYILSCKTHFQEGVCFICCKYVVCRGKYFFCLILVANDQLPVPKTHRITACLVDSHFSAAFFGPTSLWMVTLEVIKQVCCFPSTVTLEVIKQVRCFPSMEVNNRTSNNLFLLSNSSVFH